MMKIIFLASFHSSIVEAKKLHEVIANRFRPEKNYHAHDAGEGHSHETDSRTSATNHRILINSYFEKYILSQDVIRLKTKYYDVPACLISISLCGVSTDKIQAEFEHFRGNVEALLFLIDSSRFEEKSLMIQIDRLISRFNSPLRLVLVQKTSGEKDGSKLNPTSTFTAWLVDRHIGFLYPFAVTQLPANIRNLIKTKNIHEKTEDEKEEEEEETENSYALLEALLCHTWSRDPIPMLLDDGASQDETKFSCTDFSTEKHSLWTQNALQNFDNMVQRIASARKEALSGSKTDEERRRTAYNILQDVSLNSNEL